MDINALLENAILNNDPVERAKAEQQLLTISRDHFLPYLNMLTETLGDTNQRVEVRMLAGIALKNQLAAKDPKTKLINTERWIGLDEATKSKVKHAALSALVATETGVANAAAQLVAAVADIELPRNGWNDLMPVLVSNTGTENPVNVKCASLKAIGYICDTADPANPGVVAQANGILTAVVQGAQSSEPSFEVRLTAINALVNSLEFIRDNFKRENERNYIMQVVCEATQAPDTELQIAAFGALSRIMSMYYVYMKVYMEKALYGLTVEGMKSKDDGVSCMAIEFWSTVCEEEMEITLNQQDQYEEPGGIDKENYNFATRAIHQILPTLLELLTRREEDEDDDEWNSSMAAGACLQLFAQNCGSAVVAPVLQFVEANIQSPQWQNRDAAVMAFGSILDGPEHSSLTVLIGQALQPILSLMKDPSLQVKDTVAWCLGRMADLVIEGINVQNHLPAIIQALLLGLQDHPKVSTNCCWTLINLTEQFSQDGASSPTSPMSRFYEVLVPALIQATNRGDNPNSVRTSAYEALSTLVIYSADDVIPIVEGLSGEILRRLQLTIEMQSNIKDIESRQLLEELQINLLGLLTNIIRRMGSRVGPAADGLMQLLLSLLQNRMANSLIEEDVLIAISAICSAVEENFAKYVNDFMPFLTQSLENPEFNSCNTAVGLVGDICHALGEKAVPYCNTLMTLLLQNLQRDNVRRDLKPAILSCFGDIASSIGPGFEPYLSVVMAVLGQASNLKPTAESSIDMIDYIASLHEAIIDAYVGIISGLRDNPVVLLPFIQSIFAFLSAVYADRNMMKSETTLRSVVGLLGDIASMYPNGDVKNFYNDDWITDLVKRARSSTKYGSVTNETARWAREQVKKQQAML